MSETKDKIMNIETESVWLEKARSGHIVKVDEVLGDSVTIRHIKAHNIRAISGLSELSAKNFLRRYKKVSSPESHGL